jgi:hypothetical protein
MEAIMQNSATQLGIGALIALAIVSVSAATAAEQTLLVNRDEPFVSETDGSRVSDREQLRRYFLEDWRGNASYQRP